MFFVAHWRLALLAHFQEWWDTWDSNALLLCSPMWVLRRVLRLSSFMFTTNFDRKQRLAGSVLHPSAVWGSGRVMAGRGRLQAGGEELNRDRTDRGTKGLKKLQFFAKKYIYCYFYITVTLVLYDGYTSKYWNSNCWRVLRFSVHSRITDDRKPCACGNILYCWEWSFWRLSRLTHLHFTFSVCLP